jgi:hypothetical protein
VAVKKNGPVISLRWLGRFFVFRQPTLPAASLFQEQFDEVFSNLTPLGSNHVLLFALHRLLQQGFDFILLLRSQLG